MIITIVILVILATIAFINLSDYPTQARETKILADLKNLEKAMELYFIENGRYPEAEEINGEKYFGELSRNELKNIFGELKNPETEKYFNYELSEDGEEYRIFTKLEETGKTYEIGKILKKSEKENLELLSNKERQAKIREIDRKTAENCTDGGVFRSVNGVTMKANDCAIAGEEYEFEGEKYYVAKYRSDVLSKIRSGYIANNIVTTKITDMYAFFSSLSGLGEFNEDISNWDTSNVTKMEYMFSRATNFNQDISNWDVSNVTIMNSMFSGASSFNQPLDKWDTSNVTRMRYMFDKATNFNQDISNWNVSKVTDMRSMFSDSSFDQSLENWDVSNVTDMEWMFYNAKSFNQDLSSWCVEKISEKPRYFDSYSNFRNNASKQPKWGQACN